MQLNATQISAMRNVFEAYAREVQTVANEIVGRHTATRVDVPKEIIDYWFRHLVDAVNREALMQWSDISRFAGGDRSDLPSLEGGCIGTLRRKCLQDNVQPVEFTNYEVIEGEDHIELRVSIGLAHGKPAIDVEQWFRQNKPKEA